MSIIRNAVVLGVVGVVGVAGSSRAADAYKVSGAEVVVVCPLTVGGSFEARTKSVSGEVAASTGEPGSVSGSLRVDLQKSLRPFSGS